MPRFCSDTFPKSLLNTLHGIIYIFDITEQRVVFANSRMTELLGYTLEDLSEMGMAFTERFFHPDDYLKLNAEIGKMLTERDVGVYSSEYRVRCKNGIFKWFECHTTIHEYDTDGNPMYLLGNAYDISDRKAFYSEIEKSEQKLKAVFEQSGIGIALVSANQKFIDVNSKFCSMLGYTKDELLELDVHDITYQEDVERTRNAIQKMLDGNKTEYNIDKRYLRKDGTLIWVNLNTNIATDFNGEPIFAIASISDISKHKQSEEDLKKAKHKADVRKANIQAIIENTTDSIWAIDKDYKITYINKVFRDEFFAAFGRELLIGDSILHYLPDTLRPTWKQRYDRVFSGEHFKFEDVVYDENNNAIYIEVSMNPIIAKGEVLGASFFGNNITPRKQQEQELIRAKNHAEESDRLKTAFLRNISHEVRTPLNAINGFSQILTRPSLTPESREKFSNIIQSSVAKLTAVIESMITVARIETNQLTIKEIKFDPTKLICELYDIHKKHLTEQVKQHILFEINYDKQAPCLFTSDYTLLSDVLSALLDNAIKFTNTGKIEIGCRIETETVVFYVSDTGIGIPQSKQQTILKSFAQADEDIQQIYGGTGLGLSIVYGVVKALGGTLEIISRQGEGTCVTLSFPKTKLSESPESSKLTELKSEIGLKILIAEDEMLNYQYIKTILKHTQLILIHAADGQKALDLYKEYQPALILMDIKMPLLDGFAVTAEIRKSNPDIPIIAQTAFAFKREDCINAGFTDYISKPYASERLFKVLSQFIALA